MENHTDIILSWPQREKDRYGPMAEDLGELTQTIAVWKCRGNIPPERWLDVVAAARKNWRVKGVTLQKLAETYQTKGR